MTNDPRRDLTVTLPLTTQQITETGSIHTVTVRSEVPCAACHGTGCVRCDQRGRGLSDMPVSFRLPAGIDFGKRIRLAGQGLVGPDDVRGDLYVEIVPPPPPPGIAMLTPSYVGRKITPNKLAGWADEMAPILYPDERVDYVARTLGISPSHDHCIVTSRRVWVSYTSPAPTPALHYAREFITDATPLKKSRIVLHTADGAQHDIRLDFAEDRPTLLELLQRPASPPPDHFVPYAGDLLSCSTHPVRPARAIASHRTVCGARSPTRVRCRKGHAAGCPSFVPPA